MGGVLALDISTRCGWALWQGSARVLSGVYHVPQGRFGRRLHRFAWWLDALLAVNQVSHLVYEAPLLRQGPNSKTTIETVQLLMGLTGVACMTAEGRDVGEVEAANNQTVRAHFLGSARGDRKELKAKTIAVCRALGWDPKDDNEADALAVLHYTLHKHRYQHGLPSTAMFAKGAA